MKYKTLLLISGASGSGKDTVINGVIDLNQNHNNNITIRKWIPWTTRAKRKNEVNNQDYYFLNNQDENLRLLPLLENGVVRSGVGNDGKDLYGYIINQAIQNDEEYQKMNSLEHLIKEDNDIIYVICDVEGKQKIIDEIHRYQAANRLDNLRTCSVFIEVLGEEITKSRMRKRDSETQQDFNARLEHAKIQNQFKNTYDYVLINDDLEETIYALNDIVNECQYKNQLLENANVSSFPKTKRVFNKK